MLTKKFGIEIELTGITRDKASKVVKKVMGGEITRQYDGYDTRKITAPDGRVWKVVSDSSLRPERRGGTASDIYKVEVVSPILTANDFDSIQTLARELRGAGGFTNSTCGIHIHLDGADHTVRSIKNFIQIIASKNDLFYKALQIEPARMRYCKKMDEELVRKIKTRKPQTMQAIKDIWYNERNAGQHRHYHESRYHLLNLHSFFTNGTVELRGFNSTLHAGKIKAYILLALALNHQALTQAKASSKKSQDENEKFAMRVYLNRIGFIGAEYKNYRDHLIKHLDGSSAWRYGYDDPRYKKNKKKKEEK